MTEALGRQEELARQKEAELLSLVDQIVQRERRARLRSALYTLIPIVMGAAWLLYAGVRVRGYESRADVAEARADSAEARKRGMDGRLAMVQGEVERLQKKADSLTTSIAQAGSAASSPAVLGSLLVQTRELQAQAAAVDSQLRTARAEPAAGAPRSTVPLAELVERLFDANATRRIEAYTLINRHYRSDPRAVDALLDHARQHMADQNGVYNTVVTLKTLSRTVTQPRADDIRRFCDEIGRLADRGKTVAECAGLIRWIETPR